MRPIFFTLALAALPVAAFMQSSTVAQTSASRETDMMTRIDARYDETARLAREIWELAEVGYQEDESSQLLQDALAAEGFAIETGVAGIPTAFTASWGNNGPVIGVLAEFDALPGINQDAKPERAPIDGKHAGHACGHNLFGAGSVGAAIAVKNWLERSGTPGTIRFTARRRKKAEAGKYISCALACSTMSTSRFTGMRMMKTRQPHVRAWPTVLRNSASLVFPPTRPARRKKAVRLWMASRRST